MKEMYFDGFSLDAQTAAADTVTTHVRSVFVPDAACVPFCDEAVKAHSKQLYIPSLDLPDATIDALIDYALTENAKLFVRCASTLEEAGRMDSRFGKSDVMLLYSFGLLDTSTVVGGAYLDKDDLALMAQQNVPLCVLPSEDAGYGRGIAPVCAALDKGVAVRLGTGDGVYNPTRSVLYEAKVLRLLVSAQMNRRDAVDIAALAVAIAADSGDKKLCKTIQNHILS